MVWTPSKLPVCPRMFFPPIIVLAGVEVKVQSCEVPAGEGPRGFADILLGVVVDAHREQFHDLAGKILVR